MSERPRITPGALAAITARVPSRAAKKLDASPTIADTWAFDVVDGRLAVRTEGGETVSLPLGTIEYADALTCTCLLSPRCFHVLAVASILALAEVDAAEASANDETSAREPTTKGDDPQRVTLDAAQRRAASELAEAAGRCLAAGARRTGALLQGELLRAIHETRALGLHRASQAGLAFVRAIRLLRADDATFAAGDLVAAMTELLDVTERLDTEEAVAIAWIGRARREYVDAGALDVSGFAVMPVVSATGYGGVVTSLVASDGRFFEVSDVRPGDVMRAKGAYESGVAIGDTSLAHRELCRAGLFIQNGTRSSDGRLGAGAKVRAVRQKGRGLDDPHLARRFDEDFRAQLTRVARASEQRGEGDARDTWAFLRATVVAAADDGGLFVRPTDGDEPIVHVGPGFAQRELASVANLACLALDGLALRLVVRVLEGSGALVAVAVAPDPRQPEKTLRLPESLAGVAMVAFDPLSISALPPLPQAAVRVRARVELPVVALERWLLRIALGGVVVVPEPALLALRGDATKLAARGLETSASVLVALGVAATSRARPRALGRALLAATLVVQRFRAEASAR